MASLDAFAVNQVIIKFQAVRRLYVQRKIKIPYPIRTNSNNGLEVDLELTDVVRTTLLDFKNILIVYIAMLSPKYYPEFDK